MSRRETIIKETNPPRADYRFSHVQIGQPFQSGGALFVKVSSSQGISLSQGIRDSTPIGFSANDDVVHVASINYTVEE